MDTSSKLKGQAVGLLVLYAIQFLAGMTLNLFVTLPKNHPGVQGSNYFIGSFHGLVWALTGGGGWELVVHVLIALMLLFGSTTLFIRSLLLRDTAWAWLSGVAALFTLGALFNGLSFVDYGHDFSSMIMATCWLVAVSALVGGLISQRASKTRHHTSSA